MGLAISVAAPLMAAERDSAPLAPIVLQLDRAALEKSRIPAAGAARTSEEVFWLSMTALLTFGVPLLDLPNVLERGAADTRAARLCAEQWQLIRDRPASTLLPTQLASLTRVTLRDEIERLLAERAAPVAVELSPDRAAQPTPAPTMVHALIAVAVEPVSPGCHAEFRASAALSWRRDEATAATPLATISQSQRVAVADWARDPELGAQALNKALRRVAAGVVEAYPWRAAGGQ